MPEQYSPLLEPQARHEQPLSPPPASPSEDDVLFRKQEPSKPTSYLILMTVCIGGLQIAWSVELAYLSPFLLSLGLSKAILALIWIAGPLSGTLVQPYVGMRSDACRLRWGRRRPFIVGGAVATMLSLLFLAWCREIMAGIMGVFGSTADSPNTIFAIQLFAVSFVYILDFSINVIQAAIRAFFVDCVPSHQQSDVNAWASRMTGMGNILGYLSGYVELSEYLPFFGSTQFQVLSALTCLAMITSITISTSAVSERDPRLWGEANNNSAGLIGFFIALYRAMKRLPKQTSRICQVQLAAWIGWFPFLFYITTYVAEIYADPIFEAHPNLTDNEINEVMDAGTRRGTFALFVFALTTFTASVFLPFIVSSNASSEAPQPTLMTSAPVTGNQAPSSDYFSRRPGLVRRRTWRTFSRHHLNPNRLQIKWLTLRRAWLLSHIVFTILMWCTFFIKSVTSATILVGAIGLPWALSNWAPFALISAEISKREAIRLGTRLPPTAEARRLAHEEDDSHSDSAGVVLGIHNVAIAAPQVIATLVSSVIFKALQKPRGEAGDDSVAWVLRFGGLCTILAAWATTRVGEAGEDGG